MDTGAGQDPPRCGCAGGGSCSAWGGGFRVLNKGSGKGSHWHSTEMGRNPNAAAMLRL